MAALVVLTALMLPVQVVLADYTWVFIVSAVVGLLVPRRAWLYGAILGIVLDILRVALVVRFGADGSFDPRSGTLILVSNIVFPTATAEITYRLKLLVSQWRTSG